MKATIFRSKVKYSFKKYVDYVLSKAEKSIIIDSNNLIISSSETIIQSFISQANRNKRVKYPEVHLAISFTDEEYNSITNGSALIRKYLKCMNWTYTQYLAVEHKDKAKHHHYHIVLNLINNSGERLSDSFCIIKSNIICRKLTEVGNLDRQSDLKIDLKESLEIALEESSTMNEFQQILNMEFINSSVRNKMIELSEIGNRKNSILCTKAEIKEKLKICPVSNLNVSDRPYYRVNGMSHLLYK